MAETREEIRKKSLLRKSGRARSPLVPLDKKKVIEMGEVGCSIKEIANYFGIAEDTFLREYAREYAHAKAKYKQELRFAQKRAALSGGREAVDMLKHLGKHHLDQTDNVAAPVQINIGSGNLSTEEALSQVLEGEFTEIDPRFLPPAEENES